MKSLLVISSLLALASSRPDAAHVPSGSYLPSSHVPSGSYLPSSTIGIGSIGSYSHGGSLGGYTSGASFGHGGGLSFGHGGGLGFSGHGGDIGLGHGGFSDQKHVYFYAAPDEGHHSRLRINVIPNSQRNTKVIFVKAPSYGAVVPEVIAPPSISEDKTLVYVLVKRPEHGGQINIPAGAGVVQAKPEVHFIRYNNQHDAEAQISGTLHGQHAGSHVPDVGTASNFVNTLDAGLHGGHSIGGYNVGGHGIGGHAVGGHGIGGHAVGGHGIGIVSHGGSSHGGSSHGGGVHLGGGGHGLVSGGARYGPPGVSGPY